MDIAAAILHCRPAALWSCGDTYESIVWLDEQQAKPTEAELEAAWAEIVAERQAAQQATAALAAARLAMAAILDALPVADRAIVLPIRTSVEAALDRGDIELALYTVSTATVPEHLESTRTQILALFS